MTRIRVGYVQMVNFESGTHFEKLSSQCLASGPDTCPEWHYCNWSSNRCEPCTVCEAGDVPARSGHCSAPLRCSSRTGRTLKCQDLHGHDSRPDLPGGYSEGYVGSSVKISCKRDGSRHEGSLRCELNQSRGSATWRGDFSCVTTFVPSSTAPTTAIASRHLAEKAGPSVRFNLTSANTVGVGVGVGVVLLLIAVLSALFYIRKHRKQRTGLPVASRDGNEGGNQHSLSTTFQETRSFSPCAEQAPNCNRFTKETSMAGLREIDIQEPQSVSTHLLERDNNPEETRLKTACVSQGQYCTSEGLSNFHSHTCVNLPTENNWTESMQCSGDCSQQGAIMSASILSDNGQSEHERIPDEHTDDFADDSIQSVCSSWDCFTHSIPFYTGNVVQNQGSSDSGFSPQTE